MNRRLPRSVARLAEMKPGVVAPSLVQERRAAIRQGGPNQARYQVNATAVLSHLVHDSLTRRRKDPAQGRNVTGTEITLSVDEDRRCAVDAVCRSGFHVSLYPLRESTGLDGCTQSSGIDTRLRTPLLETSPVKLVLVGEQPIVHHPEGVGADDRVHGFRSFRGALCMRMYVAEREMAKHRAKGVRFETPYPGKRQLERAGVRTLVVAVDQHRSQCTPGAADVVVLYNVQRTPSR